MAGYNLRGNIYRINFDPDDVVGGAMVTGTLQYENVMAQQRSFQPEQLVMQQGLETTRTFSFMVKYKRGMVVRERDELEITRPYNHSYINERFRIKGVQQDLQVPDDPRNYLILYCTRSERAHAQQ